MIFALITKDPELVAAAKEGFHPGDEVRTFTEWTEALEHAHQADLLFVDLIATLNDPHLIAGYEAFARSKMAHPTAARVPLVLIAPDPGYKLDYMVGWPDFVFGHIQRPVNYKVFRRASTWV
jgi:hypothetical protein